MMANKTTLHHHDGSISSGSHLSGEESTSTGNDYTSHSGSSSNNTDKRVREASAALVGRETRYIYWSKGIFFAILLMAAAGSSYAVYRISARDQERAYETRFDDFANEVLAVSELNAQAVVTAFDSFALNIAAASSTHGAWPNVTVGGFEAMSQQLMEYTEAVFVELAPIVTHSQRAGYQAYVQATAPLWIAESLDYWHTPDYLISVPSDIYDVDRQGQEPMAVTSLLRTEPYFAPVGQYAPVQESAIHLNLLSDDRFFQVHNKVVQTGKKVLSDLVHLDADPHGDGSEWPHAIMVSPVFDKVTTGDQTIVAFLGSEIGFEAFLHDLLPEGIDPIYVVVRNTCNQEITYLVDGPEVIFLGEGDLHESKRNLVKRADFTAFETLDECQYSMYLHPSIDFYNTYHTSTPIINAVAVGATFLLTALLFVLYDYLVESRQRKVMKSATKSAAIVSSLFPKNVRDRLMRDDQSSNASKDGGEKKRVGNLSKAALASNPLLAPYRKAYASKPIADLFPNVSVMFADIVGFTAWSSTREPSQVFELLESVYSTMDKVARKLKVFKVETIGDCYVAACGLPEPEENHAVIITRFSKVCMEKMHTTVHRLAGLLGPDTSNLTMRIGIHSGPVTAGVLRGEKSRFQLFGDTVNTTARIESSGMPRRIHVSQETADLLVQAGKDKWVVPREDAVQAKGKGWLKTYWVVLAGASTSSDVKSSVEQDSTGLGELHDGNKIGDGHDLELDDDEEEASLPEGERRVSMTHSYPATAKMNELEVTWNADILKSLVRKIVAFRGQSNSKTKAAKESFKEALMASRHPLEEVKEVIDLPNKSIECSIDPEQVQLSKEVEDQIQDYVRIVATMYRNNAFHNFSHASHVVQSTLKLLSRIVAAEKIDYSEMTYRKQDGDVRHKFSYGITSDPITQFACVFAALIHDVDHCGVTNSQLVKEESRVAVAYDNKSVAEQNSLDLAWDLLMEDAYADFRACLYTTEVEFQRFRQLLVNMVMATDIMDKDLKQLRNDRWEKAFAHRQRIASSDNLQAMMASNNNSNNEDTQEEDNRMATIVIEHLIQASDVAHTMQHWHVYTKWNERLFHEMYAAFKAGRADKDPSLNWYEGELGFFDFYIIPLAKKLQECKIFGVSSDEYLNYAQANRKEWETRGRETVAKYLEAYKA